MNRTFLRYIGSCVAFLFTLFLNAATCTAVLNGNWNSVATWSCGHVPVGGDLVVIPNDRTVTISSNVSYTGTSLRIQVYGTLYFDGGGAKLSLPCNSIVELMNSSSRLRGNSNGNSQTIKICNDVVWSVGSDNNASGYAVYPAGGTLPVELLSFEASAHGDRVDLNWSTGSESQSDHFRILLAIEDGSEVEVARIPASGYSSTTIDYHFIDHPGHTGVLYYRLVQVDLNGDTKDYGVVALTLDHSLQMVHYPTPSTGVIWVENGYGTPGTFQLFDAAGIVQLTGQVLPGRKALDLSALQNGVYTLYMLNGEIAYSSKVIIAN